MSDPFFIVGCPRSGTTLVRLILDSHTKLAIAPESSFLMRMERLKWLYGNLRKERNLRALVEDILSIKRVSEWFPKSISVDTITKRIQKEKDISLSKVIETIFLFYKESRGKELWGDKTPENLLYIKEIKKNFPKSKYILIVRDGRDVALSLKNVDFGGMNMVYAAEMWATYVHAGEKCQREYPKNTLQIKYEDLLEDPEKELRKVCTFLGISYEENILEKYLVHPDDVGHSKSTKYGKALEKNNQGKWKTQLSEQEKNDFEAIAQKELAKQGYEIEKKRKKMSFLRKKFYLYLEYFYRLTNKVYMANYYNVSTLILKRMIKNVFIFFQKE